MITTDHLINNLFTKWKTHIWIPRCNKLIEWEINKGINKSTKRASHYRYTVKQRKKQDNAQTELEDDNTSIYNMEELDA